MDASAVAEVFRQRIDRELWVVTAAAGPQRGGLIATSVSNASIVEAMPRVVVGLSRQHFTWELVEASGAFGLHLFGEEQGEWFSRFALQSGRDVDKLAGLAVQVGVTGTPLLRNALVALEARVETRLEVGDRTIYLAEIVAALPGQSGSVLTVQRIMPTLSEEQRCELRRRIARDASCEAEAIRQWRLNYSRASCDRDGAGS